MTWSNKWPCHRTQVFFCILSHWSLWDAMAPDGCNRAGSLGVKSLSHFNSDSYHIQVLWLVGDWAIHLWCTILGVMVACMSLGIPGRLLVECWLNVLPQQNGKDRLLCSTEKARICSSMALQDAYMHMRQCLQLRVVWDGHFGIHVRAGSRHLQMSTLSCYAQCYPFPYFQDIASLGRHVGRAEDAQRLCSNLFLFFRIHYSKKLKKFGRWDPSTSMSAMYALR